MKKQVLARLAVKGLGRLDAGKTRMGKHKKWKKSLAVMMSLTLSGTLLPVGDLAGFRVSAEEDSESEAIVIDGNNLYAANGGVYEGWGTSLCWFGNRIGASEQTTDQAARYLISDKEGLGLDIIRFNIGGGDDPSHDHITRTDSKMPGYWGTYDEETDTFTYDMTKDERQRAVLLAMLKENKDLNLEAFSNSPPYFMTVSGCTSGSEDGSDNLKADKYDEFADYLATVVEKYKEEYGVTFRSVEAMNENGWSIERNGNKQEGCSFAQGDSQSKMIVALDQALKNHGLEDLTLAGCDESGATAMLQSFRNLSEEAQNALERIDTHMYSIFKKKEIELSETAKTSGKNLWMSEVDGGSTVGGDAAGEMKAGLWFAGQIAHDQYYLQPSAWIMWQAIGSYCGSEPFDGNSDPKTIDRASLDTNGFWGVSYADMDKEEVVRTKKYYAFGQYTRYIHEGDLMLVGDDMNTIAYDKNAGEVKIVAINKTKDTINREFAFQNLEVTDGQVQAIRTSGDLETGENWAEVDSAPATDDGFTAELAPFSVTTYIIKGIRRPGDEPVVTQVPDTTPETATTAPEENPQTTPETATTAPEETPETTSEAETAAPGETSGTATAIPGETAGVPSERATEMPAETAGIGTAVPEESANVSTAPESTADSSIPTDINGTSLGTPDQSGAASEAPMESSSAVPATTPGITAIPSEVPATNTAQPATSPAITETSVPAETQPSATTSLGKVSKVKVSKRGKKSAVISWKAVKNAKKYVVAYSADQGKLSKLKNGKTKAAGVKTKTVAKTSCTLSGLKKKTKYYVKICALKKEDGKTTYGKYSAAKSFKTK